MYFDAHCHLDFDAFHQDLGEVLQRCRDEGVNRFIVSGVRPSSWKRQRRLANDIVGVEWTAGIHPVVAAQMTASELQNGLEALAAEICGPEPPVGIGETGLDRRFAPKATLSVQKYSFRQHLAMAREFNRPVVLHIVDAHGAALDIIKRDGLPQAGGMVHSFSGHEDLALAYVKHGLHISFSASVCQSRSRKVRGAASRVPDAHLLVETDSPDQPLESGNRNEPLTILKVAQSIAALRGCETELILRISARNCARLFGLSEAVHSS